MKRCNYCGKESNDAADVCGECGSTFATQGNNDAKFVSSLRLKISSGSLDAWSATLILFGIVAAQIFTGAFMTAAAAAFLHFRGGVHPDLVYLYPSIAVLSLIVGGAVLVSLTSMLIHNKFQDASPCGAAWIMGAWRSIAQASALGLMTGTLTIVIDRITRTGISMSHLGQFGKTPTLNAAGQIVVALAAVLLVPFVEELLFRGVLYGGYRKSFGPFWAAITTTFLFLATHLPGILYSLSEIIGLTGLSLIALWGRLRWKAVGPAVAVHFGYNFSIALSRALKN